MACVDSAVYEGSIPFEDADVDKQVAAWAAQRKAKSIFLRAVETVHDHSGELDRKALFLSLRISMPLFKQIEEYLHDRGIVLNEMDRYEYPNETTQLIHSRMNGPEITR